MRRKDLAWTWWRSLSMREQDELCKEYFPAFSALDVMQRTHWVVEIWEKEGSPNPTATVEGEIIKSHVDPNGRLVIEEVKLTGISINNRGGEHGKDGQD